MPTYFAFQVDHPFVTGATTIEAGHEQRRVIVIPCKEGDTISLQFNDMNELSGWLNRLNQQVRS